MIGTNDGGFCDNRKNRIYFTYFEKPECISPEDTFVYIGTHVHVNDTRADISKMTILIGFGLGLLATIILWNFYGAIGTVSFSIPIIFSAQQQKSVKAFNSFMVRRK